MVGEFIQPIFCFIQSFIRFPIGDNKKFLHNIYAKINKPVPRAAIRSERISFIIEYAQRLSQGLKSRTTASSFIHRRTSIILAGAGSGKTRVLTYKVVYLIQEKGVDPSNILMVTFTNKAANEMKERIQKFIPGTSAIATTFHSLCNRILRRDGVHIGVFPNFAIYDDHDQIDTVKEAMKMLNISNRDFKPSSVMANISQAKNELITEAEYPSFARGHFQETVAKIYTVYQKLLKENNALDFDDLILKTIYLFDTNPQILSKYQKQFEYVLVDEYQDTNKAQYLLTKLFLGAKILRISALSEIFLKVFTHGEARIS